MSDAITLASARQQVDTNRARRAWDGTHGPAPLQWAPLNSDYTYANGMLQLAKRRTKLAIVCGAPTRIMAPLDDDEWEVWALNVCKPLDSEGRIRADVWFELHPNRIQSTSDHAFIEQNERPCYTTAPRDGVSAPCAMPLDYHGICAANEWPIYFTCTMAYQLMLAITLQVNRGVKDIHRTHVALYGVELLLGNGRERTVEAACLSFWLGLAWDNFARVETPDVPGCLLRSTYDYGFDYEAEARDVGLMTSAHRMSDLEHSSRRSQQ